MEKEKRPSHYIEMKRILIAALTLAGIIAIIVGCAWPGVDQHERDGKPVNPWQGPPTANAFGCGCTIQAMGVNLVDAMTWSNPVTGHTGSGLTIFPEFGSAFNIYTDPSINCGTNQPNVAAASFTCHGTNMPYAKPIALPPNCNGVQGTVNGDCSTCVFTVSINSNAFWCNVFAPRK